MRTVNGATFSLPNVTTVEGIYFAILNKFVLN